ncbi:MAG: hypothetical protein CVU13_04985 [Bacteroidetes bacterium HGW-Bacteroidetes-8]|jgi:uncharacterized protein (TIGR02145 family)|nr:MAG: hypothetical protein CVU13_04985 [Bacteroidetes bacterium HGW-Bacteroidetes-8]
MKKSANIFMLVATLVFLTAVVNCKKDPPKTIPIVSTSAITNVTSSGAGSGGNVTDDGGAAVTARGVCWSANQNPTTSDAHTTDGSGTGSFSSTLTNLQPGTTYYVRAYATNSVGTAYGSQVSTATSATAPTVLTATVSSITTASASSGGSIPTNGGGEITQKGVCWGTAQNPTFDGSKTSNGTGSQAYSSNISGLDPNTKYYVRAYAVNSAGTSYGSELSFTTKGVESLVKTEMMFPGSAGTPATAIFDGLTVNCLDINGFKIFQGDIIISSPENQATKGTAITSTINYWPENRVFYKIGSKVNKSLIESAILEITQRTNLIFIPTFYDANYIEFIWDKDGCSSYVGRIGGKQSIWLADWGTKGTIIHEICHSLGIKHEHSRPDRDDYLIIIDTNIIKGYENNFNKLSNGKVNPSDALDFNSIMLYSPNAFSKNEKPTIVKKDNSVYDVQRDSLSKYDVEILNDIYPAVVSSPYVIFDEVGILASGVYEIEGDVRHDGGAPVTMRGVCWSTTNEQPTLNHQYKTSGTGNGKFTVRLDNLVSGTTYKFRAFAINSSGTSYSRYSMDYTHPQLPTVTTGLPENVTSSTAAIQGNNVTTDGIIPLTLKGVCWSINQNPTISDSKTNNGSAIATFNSTITGLQPGTKYYARAYATNYIGTAYGEQVSFTTTTPPIAAFIASPTAILPGGAVQFTDQSTNNPISWSWNFGDGGTSTLQNPSHVYTAVGSYTVSLTATNEHGSSTETKNNYISVNTTITDIAGNVYNIVTIGTQTWMAENLKTTRYNDNAPIQNISDKTIWENATTPGYCDYNNIPVNSVANGRLYNYYAVATGKLCPTGWRVSTNDDWNVLETYLTNNGYGYLGSGDDTAKSLSEKSGWNASVTPGTVGNNQTSNNQSGFSAIPAGWRHYQGYFYDQEIGLSTYWWTSTVQDATKAWSRSIFSGYSKATNPQAFKTSGFSVRCVKN